MINTRTVLAALVAIAASEPACGDVTISTDATQNMSCSGGVCEPTAADAVLNVSDLQNYLAAGNLEVTTTGSGVEASDIDVEAALSWSNASALSLVASQSIEIDQPVSVTGTGGLSLSNNGAIESLAFGSAGNVTFANLSSSLLINGTAYTLENTVKGLAAAIANKPKGNFALATSYDAQQDRIYSASPVSTVFGGVFEGLGNAISKLRVHDVKDKQLGMFDEVGPSGMIRDVGFVSESVEGRKNLGTRKLQQDMGGVVADNYGTVFRSFTSGMVFTRCCHNNAAQAGGLVGVNWNGGTIEQSYSTARVEAGNYAGGLAAINNSTIAQSYATGSASGFVAGGLVSVNLGAVSQAYATGSAAGELAGGLLGDNGGTVTQSYSTGGVSGGDYAGGFVGVDGSSSGNLTYCYWDLNTSGISNPSQGAGNISNDPGITGLTTAQLQSGLPDGFDPTVWAESSSINNGLPYLISNPPPN